MKVIFVILSYLLGSVPYSYLLGRFWAGKEIQEDGSRSIGATNLGRVTGNFALAVGGGLLDGGMKGALSVFLGYQIFHDNLMIVLMFLAVMIGHLFPIFTKFKGGKSVAALYGGMISLAIFGIFPWQILVFLFGIWLIGIIISAFFIPVPISLANMILIYFLMGFLIFFQPSWFFIGFALIAFGLIIWSHRENIYRLRSGVEKGIRIKRRATKGFQIIFE